MRLPYIVLAIFCSAGIAPRANLACHSQQMNIDRLGSVTL